MSDKFDVPCVICNSQVFVPRRYTIPVICDDCVTRENMQHIYNLVPEVLPYIKKPKDVCKKCHGTGITDGWTPTYSDPCNSGLAPEAEPCDCGVYKSNKEAKPNG